MTLTTDRYELLQRLNDPFNGIPSCTKCKLAKHRKFTVFGSGNWNAPDFMAIGEAPGMNENRTGVEFVGSAGVLLRSIIKAMGYIPDEVYITNILKCLPAELDEEDQVVGFRAPELDEVNACLDYLSCQIDVIQPKHIITLGLPAYIHLMQADLNTRLKDVKGQWTSYNGMPVMPTYHPSWLLRNRTRANRIMIWQHFKAVAEKCGRVRGDISSA